MTVMPLAFADEVLPWGETVPECARAALDDERAPDSLRLAAFIALNGDERPFRSVLGRALDLHEREQ